MDPVYEPAEDSELIKKFVPAYSKGTVLDMCTGTGILAHAAKDKARSVLGLDINPKAVSYAKKKYPDISFHESDLFRYLRDKKKKFDLIICNPPYLPDDNKQRDPALYGGKKGYECIERFIDEVNPYLKDNGTILLLFSSLTNQDMIDNIIKRNLFVYRQIAKRHIFFEDLFVYEIQKSELLKKINRKGLTHLRYFTKGHRGILFTAKYKRKKVVIKAKNPRSKAVGRIKNEAHWLQKLNKHSIGPKRIFATQDFLVYEYVKGEFIADYVKKSTKKNIITVLRNVLFQLHKLDMLGIDKEEMHHPVKHILVDKKRVTLLDFERVHTAKRPKNVTQFLIFLTRKTMSDVLRGKGLTWQKETIIRLAKEYKKTYDLNNLLSDLFR